MQLLRNISVLKIKYTYIGYKSRNPKKSALAERGVETLPVAKLPSYFLTLENVFHTFPIFTTFVALDGFVLHQSLKGFVG